MPLIKNDKDPTMPIFMTHDLFRPGCCMGFFD